MKLARTSVAVLSVAALLGAGRLLWSAVRPEERPARPGSEASASEDPTSTDRLDDMQWQVARLRGQLGAMQTESHERSKQQAEAATESPSQASAGKRQQPYSHLPPAEVDQAIANDLHTALLAQPVDEEWSKKTTSLVETTIRGTGKAQLVSAECRSSLCRVEMTHQGRAQQESDLNGLSGKPPWNTNGFIHVIESNPPKSVVYFARQGYELPEPPNPN